MINIYCKDCKKNAQLHVREFYRQIEHFYLYWYKCENCGNEMDLAFIDQTIEKELKGEIKQ